MSPAAGGDGALERLRAEIEGEGGPLAAALDPGEAEELCAPLARAGSRTRARAQDYALLTEAILEGYLLHYGVPRLVASGDGGLRLLAGDYMYASGLQRLAHLGDLEAVEQLADLISLCAQARAGARPDGSALIERDVALWAATLAAVCCGDGNGAAHLAEAKDALRAGEQDPATLLDHARALARGDGAGDALEGLIEALRRRAGPA